MIYFDTAYIVKCYLPEPGSSAVRELLHKHQGAACCSFGRLEFSAAIKRAVRETRLDSRAVDTVFAILREDDRNAVWNWLPMSHALIDAASVAVRDLPANVVIRSADALHLTCAREHGFAEVYSNDRHMLAAASHFGLTPVNVIDSSKF
jgi:predicted nucleic acid-binding protein